ncbi:MAG: hypothetical protein ACOC33_00600 [bacterium]
MSTKIYNGYKLKNNMSFQKITIFCQMIGDLINEEREKLIVSLFTNIFIDDLICILSGGYPQDKNLKFLISFEIYNEYKKRSDKIKQTKQRDPLYDFEFEIVFIPIKNKILCLLYTEQSNFIKIWENQSEIEEYGYWNNTDKPENLSEKDWDKRKIDWDEALPNYSIPSNRGLIYNPYFEYFPLTNDFIKNISKDKVHKILSKTLLRQWWDKKHKELYNSKNKNLSYYMNFIRKLNKFINLSDSKKIVNRCKLKSKWRLKYWDKIIKANKYSDIYDILWRT